MARTRKCNEHCLFTRNARFRSLLWLSAIPSHKSCYSIGPSKWRCLESAIVTGDQNDPHLFLHRVVPIFFRKNKGEMITIFKFLNRRKKGGISGARAEGAPFCARDLDLLSVSVSVSKVGQGHFKVI